jgi:hypothetical protein
MTGKYERSGAVSETYQVTELGSGLQLVKKSKLNFNHPAAERIIDLEEFKGDRILKQKHVDYLIQSMLRGTFHPEWVNIVTCECEDKIYRMNGQHTAWARLDMPKDYECDVTLLEYEAETMEDMRILYASIDRSSPRTRANVIKAYLAGTDEFNGLKSHTIQLMPQGFSQWFWKTPTERHKHDGDDVAYLLKTDHYDLAMKVCAFLDKNAVGLDQKHIRRAPVVAAMFATFNKAPQIAVEFWKPVADGLGIETKSDPRLKLRNELQRSAVDYAGGARSEKKRVSQEYMFRQCVAAWNAYRDGRPLQLLKAFEKGPRPGVK